MEIYATNKGSRTRLPSLVLLYLAGVSTILTMAFLFWTMLNSLNVFQPLGIRQYLPLFLITLLCGLPFVFDYWLYKKHKFIASILVSFVLLMPIIWTVRTLFFSPPFFFD